MRSLAWTGNNGVSTSLCRAFLQSSPQLVWIWSKPYIATLVL
jgi:hypothetical protein